MESPRDIALQKASLAHSVGQGYVALVRVYDEALQAKDNYISELEDGRNADKERIKELEERHSEDLRTIAYLQEQLALAQADKKALQDAPHLVINANRDFINTQQIIQGPVPIETEPFKAIA